MGFERPRDSIVRLLSFCQPERCNVSAAMGPKGLTRLILRLHSPSTPVAKELAQNLGFTYLTRQLERVQESLGFEANVVEYVAEARGYTVAVGFVPTCDESKDVQRGDFRVLQAVQLLGPEQTATMVSPRTEEVLGQCAAFVRPVGKPRCGMVWMHGLGDTEQRWSSVLQSGLALWMRAGPCSFLLPRAPEQDVSCNVEKMTSWFDMNTLPLSMADAADRYGCSVEDALDSCRRVHAAVAKLAEEGVPPERVVLGGFSQGAALALLAAVTYPERLAGVVALSGLVFFQDLLPELTQPACAGLPVFWGHGHKDVLFHSSLQDSGVQALSDAGLSVRAQKYATGHSWTSEEIKDAVAFVNELLNV